VVTGPSAVIAGIGVAHPPPVSQTELWQGFFAEHYGGVGKALAKRIFEHSGVTTRHGVVNPMLENPSEWTTAQRMARFLTEAMPMGKEAITNALAAAKTAPTDIGTLVVCSCTGYVTPGLDILLARDLGLPADAQRYFIGHMGCYAAIPGLSVAANQVTRTGRPALLLCVELTSLHVQPYTSRIDPQQVVAHALFSDAAAAVVLTPDRDGYAICDVASRTDTTAADLMTWTVTDQGFRMGLSPQVPDVLGRHLRPFVQDVLAPHGLTVADVERWAIHPGGPRILDVAQAELAADITESRETLAAHGNCSSPTVLMILQAMGIGAGPAGGPVMAMAFGPGLTLYAALLRATPTGP
jgi:predicted naringenin-chalcone synthase